MPKCSSYRNAKLTFIACLSIMRGMDKYTSQVYLTHAKNLSIGFYVCILVIPSDTDLHVVWSNGEVVGDVLHECEHLLEVAGSHRA